MTHDNYYVTIQLRNTHIYITHTSLIDYLDKLFSWEKIVNTLLEELAQIRETKTNIITDNVKIAQTTRSLSAWSFGRSYAASYAYRYALDYCSYFDDHSKDCQNFASQCVYYGYLKQHGGYLTSNNVENCINPMVYNNTSADWY